MGKASELFEDLSSRPLSAAEIAAREAAAKSGGAAEATTDGRLVKRQTPTAAPREVLRVPQQTWD
jgi:hypothetical protein